MKLDSHFRTVTETNYEYDAWRTNKKTSNVDVLPKVIKSLIVLKSEARLYNDE